MGPKGELWKRTLRFTLLKPVTVGIVIPVALAGLEYLMKLISPRFRPLGYGPLALGFAIYVWCAFHFFRGDGTGSPGDPPKVLVVRGLYRWTRNPMYIGVLLMIVGLAIFFRSALVLCYAVFRFRLFHLTAINYEEPDLHNKYGASYEEYCKKVPRWVPASSGILGRVFAGYGPQWDRRDL
jgi:protein-S-isoprenylcysteine O-methyltransferase Ste14